MRCLTVLVIVGCLAAFSSARFAVKRHHEPGHLDDDDHDDDNDGSEDDDNEAEEIAEERCENLLIPCFELIAPYITAGQTSELLHNTRLRTHCTNFLEITRCFKEVINGPVCANQLEDEAKEFFQGLRAIDEVVEFVCDEKIDEFEQHETCFRGLKLDEDVEKCRKGKINAIKCDTTDFLECTNNAIDASPNCEDGAKELVEEFVTKLVSFTPECQGFKFLNKLRMKLLKMRK